MEQRYNMRSPGKSQQLYETLILAYHLSPVTAAVKRLMREAMELRDPTFMYYAQPLEVHHVSISTLTISLVSLSYPLNHRITCLSGISPSEGRRGQSSREDSIMVESSYLLSTP